VCVYKLIQLFSMDALNYRDSKYFFVMLQNTFLFNKKMRVFTKILAAKTFFNVVIIIVS